VVRWVGTWRRWNVRQATVVFNVAAVAAAIGLSVYVASGILPKWRGIDRAYERLGQWMEQADVGDDVIVMVNNPPAFWYYTRRTAVVVPAPIGDVETLLAAADRYGVTYVMLDRNWPLPPDGLTHPRLRQVEWGEDTSRLLFEVVAR
jgi:hypothetical protein